MVLHGLDLPHQTFVAVANRVLFKVIKMGHLYTSELVAESF